jgi:diguanylate cyclase (GGDEF)-like protein/PAS domain S-box-containing protein
MVIGRLSIRTKLTVVMTLLLAMTSVAVYVYFPARFRQQAVDSVVQKAAALTEMTSYSIARGVASHDLSAVAEVLAAMRRNPDLVYIAVLDERGAVYAGFNELAANQVGYRSIPMRRLRAGLQLPSGAFPQDVRRAGLTREIDGGFSSDGSVYQTSSPVRFHGHAVGTVYLGMSLDQIRADINRSKATIALVTAVTFMAGVLAVFALSTFITGPLQRIVQTAERIAEGDLSQRADVQRGDEVGQLASAFNLMIDRVHSAWRELEQWGKTLELRVADRTRELTAEVEERRRAEEALRRSEEQYRLLIERNLAGVYVASADGTILSCNEACARIFGFPSREEFLAGSAPVPYMYRHDRDSIMRRLAENGTLTNEEVELAGRDGRSIWALESIRLIPANEGAPASLEGIVLDITDRKRSEEEIAFKAYHDALTGLPNRALFLDRLRIALALAERNGTELAVLFLDLDDMKIINDTLGHATGDDLLRMLGDRLETTLRRGDTVARVGGDEFLLLLAQIHGERDAESVASKIHERLTEPFLVEDDEMLVTTSIGVAVYPADGDTAEALIRSADGAMYRIKERGGNGFELCSRMGRSGLGRLSLEAQMRSALESDEFEVYFQPQVNIATRALSGAEALVRWNHPDRSVVEPAAFIAVAEQTGLIASIGEVVLRKACSQMVAWQESGNAPPRISVNVSARQFYQRDFIGMVERVLAETRYQPHNLELEITESIAVQKTDRSLRMLRRLREMGITIAIDDFGTGQSSLSYLKRFPVDAVKIDKSFVFDIEKHASDEWIVTAVLMLATQLGLRTVAEGVESEAQCAFLGEHGCMDMQGYLISRPVPAAIFEKRMLLKPTAKPSQLDQRIGLV